MAEKVYAHNINLLGQGQLINARAQVVTDAQMTTLAGTLNGTNAGLFVYNSDQKKNFTWNGTAFAADSLDVKGDIVFKGVITKGDHTTASQVELISGYQYAVAVAGAAEALVIPGVTVLPAGSTVVTGDMILLAASNGGTVADRAYIVQRNEVIQATTTTLGNVRLATQAEVTAGIDTTDVVTSATLAGALIANQYVKQYHGTATLAADVAYTVNHGLKLVNASAFLINVVDDLGNQLSLEVDAVDVDSLTVKSVVALSGVKITVTGASTVYTKGN